MDRMFPRSSSAATSSRECTCASSWNGELRIAFEEFLRIFALRRFAQLLLDHRGICDGLRREVIVRIEVQLLHEPPRSVCRVRELPELAGRIQVVVALLRLGVPPPLRNIPPVQAHVVKPCTFGK